MAPMWAEHLGVEALHEPRGGNGPSPAAGDKLSPPRSLRFTVSVRAKLFGVGLLTGLGEFCP
jgi:hypothetical protein